MLSSSPARRPRPLPPRRDRRGAHLTGEVRMSPPVSASRRASHCCGLAAVVMPASPSASPAAEQREPESWLHALRALDCAAARWGGGGRWAPGCAAGGAALLHPRPARRCTPQPALYFDLNLLLDLKMYCAALYTPLAPSAAWGSRTRPWARAPRGAAAASASSSSSCSSSWRLAPQRRRLCRPFGRTCMAPRGG